MDTLSDRTSLGSRPAILVADDEPAIHMLLKIALDAHGLQVWAAASGPEALEVCRLHGAEIAAALLDVDMPGMDGPQTLLALRTLKPGLPCCFMTAGTLAYTEPQLLALGAAHVFAKPFNLAEVGAALRRLIGADRRSEPRMAVTGSMTVASQEATVRDRSSSGLGLWLSQPLVVGTVLTLGPDRDRQEDSPVQIEVRHCQPQADRWAIGCRYLRPRGAA